MSIRREGGIFLTENDIKEAAFRLGADVCSIGNIERFVDAPKGTSPLDLYDSCKSIIAVGIALPQGLYEVAPRFIYGHFNDGTCHTLDELELKLAKILEERFDCVAVPIPCDIPNEYWDAEKLEAKGLISMKHTARLCGLGSLGKNSLLVNPEFGNRLTIGAILTNLTLKPDPIMPDLCIPGCKKCMEICPVNAIKDGVVNQKLCRQNTYGKTARGFGTVDCNKCRTVCPIRLGCRNKLL